MVKREAFISEGLSHAVLPGIVLAYIWIEDRNSPWLIVAAGLSGLLMVWLVEWIANTNLVERDAALGIVFSGLFSVGMVATSLELGKSHFHADCIIDGNLAMATLRTTELRYLGAIPSAFVTMLGMLIALGTFVGLFFKELTLLSFDKILAETFGFRPKLLHSAWLALVAMTAVAAFEIAGTILVVALMITPAATANLLTNKLSTLVWLAPCLAAAASVTGVVAGIQLNVPPAGLIACLSGILFLAVVAGKKLLASRIS